ncbi:MFS general substrate transporter [Aspergillus campestris IBT 28561]|uniref:MFS general substrate transporter n=1 Tax=Aspergillus campestris (strain IBT 28561) TaxID=1392248 RepID=A0A2I1CSL3_ASPC2|nr:MFS general substrate transporter [Aspergillus campestris IBT 28561]PKY00615.1 MFS general substrate transporter [Aspergillus campestris IBT 28561]
MEKHGITPGRRSGSSSGSDGIRVSHDAVDAQDIVPGHQLDVELAEIRGPEDLEKIETRGSVKSKISRILSAASGRNKDGGLRQEPIPTSNLEEGIVGWEAQDDPEYPMNFSAWKKWLLLGLIALVTLTTPFASSILSPAIGSVDQEFGNDDVTIGSMTVSIYLVGYVIGPLFLAPLSEIYGRRLVLAAANLFFCVWQIGCALAPNMAALIVFRLLTGIGGAGCITLGGGVISDMFRVDQRGFAMGFWTLGPLFGPILGPLVGGYVTQTIGWRWDFWIVLMLGGVLTVVLEIFNRETNHRILIQHKVARLRKELGRDDLKSCYEGGADAQNRTQILLNGLIRPIKLLALSPLVFFLSLYVAFVYGVLYLLFTTIPTVFESVYGFSIGSTGLVYLSLGLGNFIGWLLITLFSDKSVVKLAKANNGLFQPEMRLAISIFSGIFLPITFFWYGWCAYYKTHWILPIIALAPFGFGIMGLFLPILTYLVDCYPMYAASAIAANTVLRSLVGAFLPLAGPSMYETMGLGWGNSLLGFICVGMIPLPIIFYKYGERLRKVQRFTL